MNEPSSHGTKRLYRLRDGRVVAGVCAGLAAYFGVDPTLVRLAFALLTVFGGAGVLLYLCAWVVMPEEDARESLSPRPSLTSGAPRRRGLRPGRCGWISQTRRWVRLIASMVAAVRPTGC